MKIAFIKLNFKKILLSFLFFLYIFQTPFFKINIVYILDIIFLFIIFKNIGRNPKIRFNKSIIKIFIGFSPFLLYFLLLMTIKMFSSHNSNMDGILFENIKRVGLTVFHLIISVAFLVSIYKKNKYTVSDLMDIFIIAAFWQIILVLLSYLFLDVKIFLNNLIINNSQSEAIVSALSSLGFYRGYGFAENLFDQFGYTLSLLTVIILIEGLKRKKTLLVMLSFSMLYASLLNTRTGILLTLVGIFMVFFMQLNRVKLKSLLKISVIFSITIVLGYYIVYNLSDTAFDWVSSGIKEISNLIFKNELTGTFYYLNQDILMPNDVLFGAGGAPRSFSISGIDVGYIQSIWMYGLVGTILLFFGYFVLFFQQYKSSSGKRGKIISISFLFLFLLYMIKLFAAHYPGSNFILFGIPILLILDHKESHKYFHRN